MIYARTDVRNRRRKVVRMLTRGVSPAEIAEMLGVPRDTIYNDIRAIRSGSDGELERIGRRELVAQLMLNARERTRELWELVENASSEYVKLMAIRELRIHDHMILKHLFAISKMMEIEENHEESEQEEPAEKTLEPDNNDPDIYNIPEGEKGIGEPKIFVKNPRNPMAHNDVYLQTQSEGNPDSTPPDVTMKHGLAGTTPDSPGETGKVDTIETNHY